MRTVMFVPLLPAQLGVSILPLVRSGAEHLATLQPYG
jgi:hypothetical protein